ncbi:MAG TPA: nucleoside diphosphate kinase regulator [Lacunisphaera sp.]|nr:nucleoside diphosphate kinase regulator [Lacunisphaera sp.]
MNHTPIYISRDDNSKLRRLLATPIYAPAMLGPLRKLREELDRAMVIDSSALPDDIVTMDSTVEFEDLATGEIEEYTLTYPDRADVEQKRISILAPIGTALIGYRVGDRVKWPTPGGIRELKIRRVTSEIAQPAAQLAGAAAP